MLHVNGLLPEGRLHGLSGIVFDCDGVILDSLSSNRAFYNKVLERLGLPVMTPSQEAYVHSHHVRDSVAHIVPLDRLAEAREVVRLLDYREILPSLSLFDGLRELLAVLGELGLRAGIFTNRSTTMDLVLSHFDLEHHFNPVVTTQGLTHPKPHPEGLFKILSVWRAAPAQVAFIGDSDLDEQAAHAAGVRFWSFKNHALRGEMLVSDYLELAACLRQARAGLRGRS